MSQFPSSSNPWRDCPPGELQRMLETIRIRRRRRAMKQLAGAAAAIAGSGVAGYALIGRGYPLRERRYGGLTCREASRLVPEYLAGRLSADVSRKVTLHLRECPDCGPRFRSARRRFPA